MQLGFVQDSVNDDDEIDDDLCYDDQAKYLTQCVALVWLALADCPKIGHGEYAHCKDHEFIEQLQSVRIARLEWPAVADEAAHAEAAHYEN